MDERDKLIELLDDCMYMEGYGISLVETQADYLLKNGVIVPPCKVSDTVYWISNGKVIECFVYEISQGYHDEEICLRLHIRGKWCELDLQPIYPFPHENVLFFDKKEAEQALKDNNSTTEFDCLFET